VSSCRLDNLSPANMYCSEFRNVILVSLHFYPVLNNIDTVRHPWSQVLLGTARPGTVSAGPSLHDSC
jgi:hypothetical protein